MIVEDEILEQEFLKTVVLGELLPEDKLLTCGSGIQAIEMAKEHSPNIIIMDLMLSELDGLTAIQEIRKFLPNACITIISAQSEFSYAQRAIGLRVFDYLLKPVKPKDLKTVIRRMLDTAPCGQIIEENTISKENNKNFIKDSLEFIDEHFKERLTLEMVASKVFMNPKYFSQVFKKETGIAFTEYIIQLRIEYACRLLETTNYPVYRVSTECGFSDPSYFNRVFCAQMNMTPQKYRKKSIKDEK